MSARTATLYRMVTDQHVCPYGLKARWLLEREGFEVDDQPLASREETDAIKQRYDVETTPQVFIDGQRIGGYEALRDHLGLATDDGGARYRPVIAVFGVAAGLSLAANVAAFGALEPTRALQWFIALSMAMLAMLKLQDVRSFSTMFLNYDLLARRWVPYSFIYPFAEAFAAILMLSGTLVYLSAPVALFIGTVGAVSVIKAVYIDRRELECACVGGGSKVPLGFVSLTENLAMIGMGVWMLIEA